MAHRFIKCGLIYSGSFALKSAALAAARVPMKWIPARGGAPTGESGVESERQKERERGRESERERERERESGREAHI